MTVKSLVIGYGNSLRGDDGIGRKLAQTIAEWQLPGVRSLDLHQLTPELAAELAQVELAIFIDACPAKDHDAVTFQAIKPSASINFPSHFSNPQALLSLTQAVYGRCPPAWWVMVPGVNFSLSDRLSPLAKQKSEQALREIESLLESNTITKD